MQSLVGQEPNKAREISFINQAFYLKEPWRGGIYPA